MTLLSGAGAAVLALAFIAPTAAHAAPDDAFDPNNATVFVGHDDPTQLAVAVTNDDGDGFDLQNLGGPAGMKYNALGFNTDDNYLYALARGSNDAVRIGSDGGVTDLGAVDGLPNQEYQQGTFGLGDDAGIWYVRAYNDGAPSDKVWAIDMTQSTPSVQEITLSEAVPNVSDIVYKDGALWGLLGNADSPTMYRMTLDASGDTATVSSFDVSSLGLTTQPYGGQWLYGNGNLGVTGNQDGTIYQIAIADADSSDPAFSVVSKTSGKPTTNNDAASIMGLPADLQIAKTGDATVVPGDDYSYTITVTNNGDGASSGSRVTDELPGGLLDPSTDTTGCTIDAGVLSCFVGPLAVGDSTTITVTGSTGDDVTADDLLNSASVVGNEADSNPDNNEASFGPDIFTPAPSLGLVKSASADALTKAGQEITYSFVVTNTGNVALGDVSVTEGEFSGHGTLGAVECPATPEVLEPDASVTCTADYTVVAADLDGAPLTNTATASAQGPNGPVQSDVATVSLKGAAPAVPASESTPTALAATGSSVPFAAGIVAMLVMMLGGGALLLARRRAA